MFGHEGDKEVSEANLTKLEAKLDVYDKILAKQKYLAGDVSVLSISLTIFRNSNFIAICAGNYAGRSFPFAVCLYA
jgi:glutathione S-transferase